MISVAQFKKELLFACSAHPKYNIYLYKSHVDEVLEPRYDFNFYDANFFDVRDFLIKYSWYLHPDRVKWIHKVSRDRWQNLFERETLGVYLIAFDTASDLEAYHTIIVTRDVFFYPF